jgi:DNA-binding Xre family transcriptional regulator
MKWNLRLAAANRGIWKASEFQRMLAERGLVISAGKMSGLWSGNPNVVKLDELDTICAVLGCGVEELLIPEPDTVAAPPPAAEDAPPWSARRGRSCHAAATVDRCRRGELPPVRETTAGEVPEKPNLLQQKLFRASVNAATQEW